MLEMNRFDSCSQRTFLAKKKKLNRLLLSQNQSRQYMEHLPNTYNYPGTKLYVPCQKYR